MARLLRRTAALLLTAACTRAPTGAPPSAGAAGAPAATARGAAVALASATRPGGVASPLGDFRLPPACLPSEPDPAPLILAAAAEDALERGDPEGALACADEALRQTPRLVAALSARGDALVELRRVEDARLAFAHALAIDPDDPDALLGAADLHVRRLGGKREALELGLALAERGARLAGKGPRADRELAGRFALLAGIAENDLGRSAFALRHLDRAVATLPTDPAAVYERGVAYYELCRFDDARRAFERTLSLAPEDPWAIHQLGLLAERRGDQRTADAHFARARALSPDEFPREVEIGEAEFRAEVEAAVAALPEAERTALKLAPVEVADLPDAADLLAVDPPLSPTILGLFRGPAEDEACLPSDGPRCRSIVFYRKNLARFARDRRELGEQVRVTLLHELGHLHGQDEDELRARGLE